MIEILRTIFTYLMLIVAILAVIYAVLDYFKRIIKLYKPDEKIINDGEEKT